MAYNRILVKPDLPLIPGRIKLPPLDQVESKLLIPVILVFHLPRAVSRATILNQLRTGLSNTIEELPFIASDVIPEDKERSTVELEIPSEDAGVWFYTKEAPEIDFLSLQERRFAPSSLSYLHLMPEPRLHDWKRSPVMTVQAVFITDGLLLGFNAHHSAMDASGIAALAMTWAKHVAALSEGRLLPETALPEGVLDRSGAFGSVGHMPLSAFPQYRLTKQLYRSEVQRKLLEAAIMGDHSHTKLHLLRQLQLAYWYISSESLRWIKQAAAPPSPDHPVLTENTILSALLWRHISRARGLSAKGILSSSLVNVVNIRRRVQPPLPLEYPGNALVHSKTTAAVVDIESSEPGMLYRLARQVSESIEWWTPDRIWGFNGAAAALPHIDKVEPALDNFLGSDLEVTNTSSINIKEMNWGPDLGILKAVGYPHIPIKEGWVSTLPQVNPEGLELVIGLKKETMDRLRNDTEWTSLAQEFS